MDDFANWTSAYRRADNPLFVPETRGGAGGAANALYAYGALNAIGFSPFSIESNDLAALAGDVSVGIGAGAASDPAIDAVYGLLTRLAPLVFDRQAIGGIGTVLFEGEAQRAGRGRIGSYTVDMVRAANPADAVDPASRIAAMFLQTGEDEFLVLGADDAADVQRGYGRRAYRRSGSSR